MGEVGKLIERLESAAEGSRELDCDLFIALGLWTPPPRSVRRADRRDVWSRDSINHYCQANEATTSLDAALALAERVLPRWICGIDTDGNASVWDGKYVLTTRSAFVMRQPALALCAAILRAKEQAQ